MTTQLPSCRMKKGALVIAFVFLFFFAISNVFSMEKMSDGQLEDVYARNASDTQIATNPASDVSFHYNNAIQPTVQTAGDVQTYLGAATALGPFVGPPQDLQKAVTDAQTVASGVTFGLGGL